MNQPHDTSIAREELELLFTEIGLYLEAVDAFRHEGREPKWLHDLAADALA